MKLSNSDAIKVADFIQLKEEFKGGPLLLNGNYLYLEFNSPEGVTFKEFPEWLTTAEAERAIIDRCLEKFGYIQFDVSSPSKEIIYFCQTGNTVKQAPTRIEALINAVLEMVK